MRFYFPDSQDQIDPSFEFVEETRSPTRIRQRDDLYAHETLRPCPYDGLLVSKAMIDRHAGAGRYSARQRQRFHRRGVRDFFRLDEVDGPRIDTLGDCGAFTYIDESEPPYSTEEVIGFYEDSGFDAGVSVDHVIPIYEASPDAEIDPMWAERYELTLRLASKFLALHRESGCDFEPVGVAQGWSGPTYAAAVRELQDMGYARVAIGGLVPLKTHEILTVLEAVDEVRAPSTAIHLFGITRCESIPRFREFGISSFDSTSPFRQAFKDERDNYWTAEGTFVAIRVPQVDGNARLQARVRSGEVDQAEAQSLERGALEAIRRFDRGEVGAEGALDALCAYQELHDPRKDRREDYRETLVAAPWQECGCQVCSEVGVEVVLFRGTERNKRRGFHNLHAFGRRLEKTIGKTTAAASVAAG
jgi:hypothetical protein